jgi:hypothetical protein
VSLSHNDPSTAQQENVLRGTLLSVLAIPAGVVLWVALWRFGIVASIVAFVIAFGAAWLYRKGSGGVVSRVGALVIALVVAAGILVSFWAGLVFDYAVYAADQLGTDPFTAMGNEVFWPAFGLDFPSNFAANGANFAIAIAFGALGAFRIIARAFAEGRTRAQSQTAAQFGAPIPETWSSPASDAVQPVADPTDPKAPGAKS